MSTKSAQWEVNPELYNYVAKALELLGRCKGFVNPVELDRRGVAWLDLYEENAGTPLRNLPLRIKDYLSNVGLDPAQHAGTFGRLLKAAYVEKYDKLPPVQGGVYQYTHADWELFQEAYLQLDACMDKGGR